MGKKTNKKTLIKKNTFVCEVLMLWLSVDDNQIKCCEDESEEEDGCEGFHQPRLEGALPRSGGKAHQPSHELKRALLRKR